MVFGIGAGLRPGELIALRGSDVSCRGRRVTVRVGGPAARVVPVTADYAGSVLCLSHTAEPDTSAFDAPEIVYRMKKHHHAGLIVRSPSPDRVEQLLDDYSAL